MGYFYNGCALLMMSISDREQDEVSSKYYVPYHTPGVIGTNGKRNFEVPIERLGGGSDFARMFCSISTELGMQVDSRQSLYWYGEHSNHEWLARFVLY